MSFFNGVGDAKTVMDLTGASVVIIFRKSQTTNMVFEFKTSDSTISIPTPENGEIFLQPRVMNYAPFNYIFDVVVTTQSGAVHTYFTNYWRIL